MLITPFTALAILELPEAEYADDVIEDFSNFENPFPDTDLTTLAGKSAAELYRRFVIKGYPDGEFKGYNNVNRAEAAKFLIIARFGEVTTAIDNDNQFPDVSEGEWYEKYILTAAKKSIINGYPDGYFRPENWVNTAEFLKMLTLTFDMPLNEDYDFVDVNEEDWFAQYAGSAENYNLFPNRTTNLDPASFVTREEVAVAIYQFLRNR